MSNQKAVNKITYGLLAILLGGLGAYKFYAGKWLMGIIYLAFLPIAAIVGLIEGCVALGKPADSNGNIVV